MKPKSKGKPIAAADRERGEFAERLEQALAAAGMSHSPTDLQRVFNQQSSVPVTVHAARKWLTGESIPRQSHLRILAAIVGVPAAWLRLGDNSSDTAGGLSAQEQVLIQNYRKLAATERRQVMALVQSMANLQSKR